MVKLDLKNSTSKNWFEKGCFPGEPVFIGKPGERQEDDGVIVSIVLNETKGNSFLLILNASTFTEIARVEIPHPVLFGYHGEFFQ
jgi:carotenoid cleavage dioxygenase-like enzyme